MKLRNLLLLMAFFCVLAPASPGMDGKSPFSSPEEKRFILEVAGRDGQIDREEWSRNDTDRGHFKQLTWDKLINFDLDGDGLVGVNEFYRYIERRTERVTGSDSEESAPDPVRLSRASPASPSQDIQVDPTGIDDRILFRRSQIAQRTKIQRRVDPGALRELEQNRRAHLKVMTDRRRQAARTQPALTAVQQGSIRDIYKARLVKNRLIRPGSGSDSRRNSLMDARRRGAAQNTETGRRRNALQDLRNRVTPAATQAREKYESLRRTMGPTQRGASGKARAYRDASDIRGLIPPSPGSKDGKATPQKDPNRNPVRKKAPRSQGKTRTNGRGR